MPTHRLMSTQTGKQTLSLCIVFDTFSTYYGDICADAQHDVGVIHCLAALVMCPAVLTTTKFDLCAGEQAR